MQRTSEEFSTGNNPIIADFRLVANIDPLELPQVAKEGVTEYIGHPNYRRAQENINRRMERFNRNAEQASERLEESADNINGLKAEGNGWELRANQSYNRENANAVAQHNDAVDQTRRLRDRVSDATDRHNDLLTRANEAMETQREQEELLKEEALISIDLDIVTFLDRCGASCEKLADSANGDDVATAFEASFLAMKIHSAFGGHIDGTAERRDARQKIDEIGQLFVRLCQDQQISAFFIDTYSRNKNVIDTNAERFSDAKTAVDSVSQADLTMWASTLQEDLGELFNTSFAYRGVIDPSELEAVVVEITKSIDTINSNASIVREHDGQSEATSLEGVGAFNKVNNDLLAAMRQDVEALGENLLHERHFARDILRSEVIDGFFGKEIQQEVRGLRSKIESDSGVGQRSMYDILDENDDRYSIRDTEDYVKQADLVRLQTERDKVAGHLAGCSEMVEGLQQDIAAAGEVPSQNVAAFRSSASIMYILSLFPLLGFVFSFVILSKVKKFELAFRSSNQIYIELGQEILAKNNKMRKVNTIFFLNLISALILSQAGKRLQAFMEESAESTNGLATPVEESAESTNGLATPVEESTSVE